MERGRITVFAVWTAVLITAAVLLAFFYMGLGKKTPPVAFPETTLPVDTGQTQNGEGNGSELTFAEVTPKTVQAAIKTLKRPESYSRSMAIESFWDGGGETYKVNTWSKNGETRLTITAGGWNEPKNILITKTEMYIWYGDNTRSFYKSARSETIKDKALTDTLQMIPTYEAVLELDVSDILEAGYVEREDAWYIMVKAADSNLDYNKIYYISINTGLLEAAETYDGDTLIYRMEADEVELSAPDDSLFKRP
jgi:hypothetical protein